MRLTNRQGIQLHGVLKGGLKEVIHNVCHSGLSTMGACGDVVRNTMGPAAPIKDAVHADAQTADGRDQPTLPLALHPPMPTSGSTVRRSIPSGSRTRR